VSEVDNFSERRLWVRPPCHHILEEYLIAYFDRAGLRSDPRGAAVPHDRPRDRQLTCTVLSQAKPYGMIGRRAA
jgi:hypothetical protein